MSVDNLEVSIRNAESKLMINAFGGSSPGGPLTRRPTVGLEHGGSVAVLLHVVSEQVSSFMSTTCARTRTLTANGSSTRSHPGSTLCSASLSPTDRAVPIAPRPSFVKYVALIRFNYVALFVNYVALFTD